MMEFKATQEELLRREIETRKVSFLKIDKIQMRIVSILFLCAIAVYYSGNKHLMFFVATFTSAYTIFRAKVSFFSAFTFILWFSFVQEYVATINKLIAAGMLKTGDQAPIYYVELYVCFEILLLCELIFFMATTILQRERLMYLQEISISRCMAYILVGFSLVLIILSYPTMPTLSGTLSRNEGIIASARYMPIAYYILAITYDGVVKYKGLIIGWIVAIGWVLFHGERVAAFGFLIYVAIKFLNRHSNNNTSLLSLLFRGKGKLVVSAAVLVVILGVYLQYSRVGAVNNEEMTLAKVLAQGTAGDVVYVFNCSVDMWRNGNLFHGYTLLQYLTGWLPGGNNPMLSPAANIQKYYYTVGGGLFFVEPMMNFGMVGVLPYVFFVFLFLNFFLQKPSKFMAILWIPIVTTIFRLSWYTGLTAWTFTLYTTPIIYIAINKFR